MSKKTKRKARTKEPAEEYTPSFELEESVESHTRYRATMVYLIDQDEVNSLINASESEYVDPFEPTLESDYPTFSEGEVRALIANEYQPNKKSKKKK